jgi:DNA-binding CsgD family transcriptional regulator
MTRILLGRALVQLGEPALAAAELEQAAADFETSGAPCYRDKAEHEPRRLGRHISCRSSAAKAHGEGLGSLSGRELEVARLVLDRRTNPEIAADLFLSLKTVETRLRNIFRKLGSLRASTWAKASGAAVRRTIADVGEPR